MHIEVSNLSKSYGKTRALDDVNLSLDGPGIVFLIGPNASGKTTLFKSILGLAIPTAGQIWYNQIELKPQNHRQRSAFGYMPQITRFPPHLTGKSLFELTAAIRKFNGRPDDELIRAWNLEPILDRPIMTLSGGTRQKVMAALAFYFQPEVVILDEPTAGLDPESSQILLNKLYEERERKLMFLSTHILYETNRMGHHAVYLKDGVLQFSRSLSEIRQAYPQLETHQALVKALNDSGT